MVQRIWLVPVWLTTVRIDRRQDLTSLFTRKNPLLHKNSLVDCQHEQALVPSILILIVLRIVYVGSAHGLYWLYRPLESTGYIGRWSLLAI